MDSRLPAGRADPSRTEQQNVACDHHEQSPARGKSDRCSEQACGRRIEERDAHVAENKRGYPGGYPKEDELAQVRQKGATATKDQ